MNPNRKCRMCEAMGENQAELKDLIQILPDYKKYTEGSLVGYMTDDPICKDVAAALPLLRDKANECPVCIMASLKQAHLPPHTAQDFKYKEEMSAIWNDIMARRYPDEIY